MLALEVQLMLRGFNSVEDVARQIPDGLLFSLMNQGVILIYKFQEIWAAFGSTAKENTRVVEVRRCCAPLVDRIGVWKGIAAFRSTVLAHPYQTKDGRPVGPWFLLETKQAPTYYAETILLLQCVNLCAAAVLTAFYEDYVPLQPILKPPSVTPDRGPGVERGSEINVALKPIVTSVDEALRRADLRKTDAVFKEFERAARPE